MLAKLLELKGKLTGELHTDFLQRNVYATDASVYKVLPQAVAIPKTKEDIHALIQFARENNTSIVPRTAGTSLAGQVVGNGIIVDVSKNFTQVLEVNKEEKWVRVEPGVIRDDLNKYLKPYGLFFGPETSTASRCMIGGMVGNNSCGAHSPLYGTTRDHLLEIKAILSDGSEVEFKELTLDEYKAKLQLSNFEGSLYRHIDSILKEKENQEEITREFPKPSINRRNTGYAIDVVMNSQPFVNKDKKFNFCKLIAGSEGTLAFIMEIKINLVDLPPKEQAVVAIHSNTVYDALKANIIALKYKPGASELMDKVILDCTSDNPTQKANRYFVEGDPAAILCVEFERHTKEEIEKLTQDMIAEITEAGFGYAFPVIWGNDCKKVWDLRVAGLGLLANIPGDPKGVACIEDTAVDTDDLPEFIREFDQIMLKYGKESIYYAHAGDGEIHLRPILDLKKKDDRKLFFHITDDMATLVKKYKGSLSGEHGDGRVRGQFIEKMIGSHNFKLVRSVKNTWDPNNIFNPGKIVDTPKMNEFLRYEEDMITPEIDTHLSFDSTEGIVRMAEKCNGTGVCRRTHLSGGTMCPSFMATRNEKDTTRARANILREFLTNSKKENRFDHEEIKEVMDLCLGCKGCKSDCPSNVDVAAMKSEFLQQYYKTNGVPLAANMIANVERTSKLGSIAPKFYNAVMDIPFIKNTVKDIMGISRKRDLPKLHNYTLRSWYSKNIERLKSQNKTNKRVYFFVDEIINYNDVVIGERAIELLFALGYEVLFLNNLESGRPGISKGLLKRTTEIAKKNVALYKNVVNPNEPLIGIEPSAILTFRDEYPKLLRGQEQKDSKELAKSCLLIDEFLANEFDKGNIDTSKFTDKTEKIIFHGHCHQKALSSVSFSQKIMQIPANYSVEVLNTGCCGMSGSFGYEEDKYDVSMQIGELVLFPAVRNKAKETIIAATGTSCRHQIKDGTKENSLHPVEILWNALKK
jgi:FAD/FMN-containing dehydrogenase/Fe-S oxidoreductase